MATEWFGVARLVLTTAGRVLPPGWQWWNRPLLEIYFDSKRTYTRVRIHDVTGNPLGFFCHFMVRNDGNTPALGCYPRLMAVSRLEGEAEAPVPEFRAPRRLKWANEPDFGSRPIEPGQPGRRADLCYGIDGATMVRFFVPPEETSVGVQTIFPRGQYRVRVRVDAENAASALAILDVTFTGTWDGITVRQVAT